MDYLTVNATVRNIEKQVECIQAKLRIPTRTATTLKAVELGYRLLPPMPIRRSDGRLEEDLKSDCLARWAIEHREEHKRRSKATTPSFAQEEARRLGHNFVGTEALLLGIMTSNEGIAFEVLTEFGIGQLD